MTDLELWKATAQALGWINLRASGASWCGIPPFYISDSQRWLPEWTTRADLALRDIGPRLAKTTGCNIWIDDDEVVLFETVVIGKTRQTGKWKEKHDGTGHEITRAVARVLCRALIESKPDEVLCESDPVNLEKAK